MATVHSYLRYSTMEQAAGTSEDRQDTRAEEYCSRHSHTLSELRFRDLGISGFRRKNLEKGALKAFLIAIEKGKIKPGDILLVEAIDRLSRSGVKVTQNLVNKIHAAGVDIVILFPNEMMFQHDSKNQMMDAILLACYADVAHQYSLRLSDFGKSWWTMQRKQAREKGKAISAVIPWWIIRKDDSFFVDDEKAATIQLIYQLAISGLGAHKICDHLHKKGINGPRVKNWNKTYVRQVIRQRLTLGEMQFCELDADGNRQEIGDMLENYYPAIIDEETWLQANAALDHRTTERGESSEFINLFQGLVINVNDMCPANMYTYQQWRGKKGSKEKITIRRLKSRDADAKVVGSDTATVDFIAFQNAIMASLQKIKTEQLGKADNKDKELSIKLAKLAKVKKSLASMEADIRSGDVEYDFLRGPMKELNIERQDLEEQVRAISTAASGNIRTSHKNLLMLMEEDPELKTEIREQIKSIVEKIYLLPIKRGPKRNDSVVSVCQIVYRSGVRYSLIFEAAAGKSSSGDIFPNLEDTTKKWRNNVIKCWDAMDI